jgi:hypothetical protein
VTKFQDNIPYTKHWKHHYLRYGERGRNALFVIQNRAVHDRNAGYIRQTQPETQTN